MRIKSNKPVATFFLSCQLQFVIYI